jgi:hypothetical protein
MTRIRILATVAALAVIPLAAACQPTPVPGRPVPDLGGNEAPAPKPTKPGVPAGCSPWERISTRNDGRVVWEGGFTCPNPYGPDIIYITSTSVR